MVDLALTARGLRPDNVTFVTVPTAGVASTFEGDQSVVYLDADLRDSFLGGLPQRWARGLAG